MSRPRRATIPSRFRSIAPAARAIGFFAVFAATAASASVAAAEGAGTATLAIADFDFVDTSGEVRDQGAEHLQRLKAFGDTLREDLGKSRAIGLAALPCRSDRCTATDPGLEAIASQARAAGARYLLIGEIRKMSTLVGWVKIAVLDLDGDKASCVRSLSYRGDSDEAWRRTAEFAVEEVRKHCLPR